MNREIYKRWDELNLNSVITDIANRLFPNDTVSHPGHVDGLVEAVVRSEEGYEDDNPIEHMRFSFDGNHLSIRTTNQNEPILGLLETRNVNNDQLRENLQNFVARK